MLDLDFFGIDSQFDYDFMIVLRAKLAKTFFEGHVGLKKKTFADLEQGRCLLMLAN